MSFQCKIINSENEFIEYEKGIYNAFKDRNPNNWVNFNYKRVDNCRYQTRIPYEDQIVYVAKDKGIIAAGSVNLNMNRKLQLEEIGFSLSKEMKKEKYCEALLLWNKKSEYNPFQLLIELRAFIREDLRKRGYTVCFGTCEENRIIFYSKFSFQVLDKKIIEGKRKYLIKLDI